MILTTKNMQYFVSTARTLSFSKAAEENYTSQPTISRQISLMESELGCKLFFRDTHSVLLTEAGKELYQSCVEILNQIDAAENRIRSINQQGETFTLRIGLPTDASFNGSGMVHRASKVFRNKYPSVELQFKQAETVGSLADLKDMQLDLLVIELNGGDFIDESFDEFTICSSDSCIVYGGKVPDCPPELMIPEILRTHTINLLKDDPFSEKIREILIKKYGVNFRCKYEDFDPMFVHTLPTFTDAAFIYPIRDYYESIDIHVGNNVHIARFSDDDTSAYTKIIWRKDDGNPYVRKFLKALGYSKQSRNGIY